MGSLGVTVFGAASLGLVMPHKIGGLGASFQREIFCKVCGERLPEV